jgi:pimeloyl-ACP methyl ester carboxylesterase
VAAGRQGEREGDLVGLRTTIGNYPTASDLATITTPVMCSYGARSPDFMVRRTRSFAAAIPGARVYRIEGAAHAAPFDATDNFVQMIADAVTSLRR